MLLKRLAQAFRSQDWFTVFVELLVLTVGIFLGLQVDDWNQRRLDRIEERYYLDRLGRDFARSLAEQDKGLEMARAKFETALSILEALESRSVGTMSVEDFNDRVSSLWGFPRLTLVTATTDELVANGKSSLLQSDVLREELSAFVEWYKDRERYYEFLSAAIIDAYQQQNRFFRPEWPDSDGRPRWSADPNALMNDAEVISSMRQLTSAYWQLWRDIDILNTETREMNDLLNEEIQDRGN